ncbi:protein of unknown function [Candidatus Hydrogenisulfobacillus filiaventi]|uniref:Uncharacterized protein n=1 Tax=Candidatus Hydrogenisulfobacillus filiaventi TaxID=2707344 RepID=A0A6F8ZHG7_9FIRM|nr:protein of unknown function [Candidatus Hydrogenisulfobacillus filiaventi]
MMAIRTPPSPFLIRICKLWAAPGLSLPLFVPIVKHVEKWN